MPRRHHIRPDDPGSVFTRLEELLLAGSGEDAFEVAFQLLLARLAASAERPFVAGPTPGDTQRRIDALVLEANNRWPDILDPGVRLTAEHLDACVRLLQSVPLDATRFEALDALVEHLMPFIPPMCRMYRETGFDAATWGAPAMLLFHHTKRSVSGKENCYVACTYAMLAAQALGLGTTMIGIVAGVVDMDKALRSKLDIPAGNQCEISLIIGHPAANYRRAIPRRHKTVAWVD